MTTPKPPMDLRPWVSARDVRAQLQCGKSTAYEHLARAAMRPPGVRGLLRVHPDVWADYVARTFGPRPAAQPRPAPLPSRAPAGEPPWPTARDVPGLNDYGPEGAALRARHLESRLPPATRKMLADLKIKDPFGPSRPPKPRP